MKVVFCNVAGGMDEIMHERYALHRVGIYMLVMRHKWVRNRRRGVLKVVETLEKFTWVSDLLMKF